MEIMNIKVTTKKIQIEIEARGNMAAEVPVYDQIFWVELA